MAARRWIGGFVAALVVVATGCSDDGASPPTSTTSSTSLAGTPGARGVGDPYFPDLGNGGFDVDHYELQLGWSSTATGEELRGRAEITATATQDLSRFDLDLAGLDVLGVQVDGVEAISARQDRELVITPATALADGDDFTVVVQYQGTPTPLEQGTDLFKVGWQADGREAFVASEPAGAATFFPVSDHPSDKATYTFRIEAPADLVAVANGRLVGEPEFSQEGGARIWTYEARDPMASYLVQVAIGDYELVDGGTSAAGVPIRHVLHRNGLAATKVTVARTPEMLDVMAGVFGPYPFEVYGVLAVDEPLGFALETQTLVLIGSDIAEGGRDADAILVHELAHQWVGDSVSPATWKDIWLNEGFATYAEWLWSERTGGPTAATIARRTSTSGLEDPPGDPGPDELFQPTVYLRGGLALQALRETIGDDAFFRLLRTWVDEHRGGTASTADLEALAERIAGRDLRDLFQRWIYDEGVPSR